jgi:hypothetical protein
MVSSYSLCRTCSSSKRPRIAKGRMYGLAGGGGWIRFKSRGTLETADVSRANSMARLDFLSVSVNFQSIFGKDVPVHRIVVVKS